MIRTSHRSLRSEAYSGKRLVWSKFLSPVTHTNSKHVPTRPLFCLWNDCMSRFFPAGSFCLWEQLLFSSTLFPFLSPYLLALQLSDPNQITESRKQFAEQEQWHWGSGSKSFCLFTPTSQLPLFFLLSHLISGNHVCNHRASKNCFW